VSVFKKTDTYIYRAKPSRAGKPIEHRPYPYNARLPSLSPLSLACLSGGGGSGRAVVRWRRQRLQAVVPPSPPLPAKSSRRGGGGPRQLQRRWRPPLRQIGDLVRIKYSKVPTNRCRLRNRNPWGFPIGTYSHFCSSRRAHDDNGGRVTTRNMTFCDEFLVTSELFVISAFHFMTIYMRYGGLVTKKGVRR
jgi:hypothetical protein